MVEICGDNRFELIDKYKRKLIEATNIETAPDEMAVLNGILFRFWQMGWLDKLEQDCESCVFASFKQFQPERKWIPCSERLPEESGQYYVSGGDKVWICEFLIIPNLTGGWCNDALNPRVQAWMEKPEPYRGES